MNIYEQINNNNYIIAEIEIKKEDINKNIRIINSFEQYKRENKRKERDDDNMKMKMKLKIIVILKLIIK